MAVAPLPELLIYYGYPIAYHELWNIPDIIQAIGTRYKCWVIGDGYEDPLHEEYSSTKSIITGVKSLGCKVYGYVPIGQDTSGLTIDQIKSKINNWIVSGVNGIFLDEFGFDYGNTRQRQKECVDYVHSKNLPFCANAWVVEDVVCDHVNELTYSLDDWRRVNFLTYNPTNIPLVRNSTDAYLFENFAFSHIGPASLEDAQYRMQHVDNLLRLKNIQKWAVAVLAENPIGVPNYTKTGNCNNLQLISDYVSVNAYLFNYSLVGIAGYSFGSAGTKLIEPRLLTLPPNCSTPLVLAVITGSKVSRLFGNINLILDNTTQEVSITETPSIILDAWEKLKSLTSTAGDTWAMLRGISIGSNGAVSHTITELEFYVENIVEVECELQVLNINVDVIIDDLEYDLKPVNIQNELDSGTVYIKEYD